MWCGTIERRGYCCIEIKVIWRGLVPYFARDVPARASTAPRTPFHTLLFFSKPGSPYQTQAHTHVPLLCTYTQARANKQATQGQYHHLLVPMGAGMISSWLQIQICSSCDDPTHDSRLSKPPLDYKLVRITPRPTPSLWPRKPHIHNLSGLAVVMVVAVANPRF